MSPSVHSPLYYECHASTAPAVHRLRNELPNEKPTSQTVPGQKHALPSAPQKPACSQSIHVPKLGKDIYSNELMMVITTTSATSHTTLCL